MAQKIIVFWRDIPAQVIIKRGRKSARRELPEIFIKTIDQCAMRTGAKQSDAYLNAWRKAAPVEVSDDLEAEADKALRELAEQYPQARLKQLLDNDGSDHG